MTTRQRQRKHGRNIPSRSVRRGGRGTIWCDEAGFTGNNLLDAEQEIFAFAAAAIDASTASEAVQRTIRDFRLQGTELKGSRLLKSENGRRAVTSILKEFRCDVRLITHLKKYALAAKFFEYVFEPPLASQNSLFYGVGFHQYISNLLYMHLRAQDAPAEEIFRYFSDFMRNGNQQSLEALFPTAGLVISVDSNPIEAISAFAMLNRSKIIAESELIHDSPDRPVWVLDLTSTSLFSVLRHWGEVYDELDVYCDKSKPLETETWMLEAMVGRKDYARVRMFGKESQFTFNLVQKPVLADSRDYPGIQIADVFASAAANCLQRRFRRAADDTEKLWFKLMTPCLLDDNVWPDLGLIDLDTPSAFVNTVILHELVRKSLKGENLFDGIPELIVGAGHAFSGYMLDKATRRRAPGGKRRRS